MEMQDEMRDCLTLALIHQNRLIGIAKGKEGFSFNVCEPPGSCVCPNTYRYYPDLSTALNAAIEQAEKDVQWEAGFNSCVRKERLSDTAHPEFKEGWEARLENEGRTWNEGLNSFLQGEPLLKTASPDFKEGWKQGHAWRGEETPDAA